MTEKEKAKLDDTLMQLMTEFREKRVKKYDLAKKLYREKMEKACAADADYMLLGLTDNQRQVIDHMLDLRSEAGICELTITYMAGLLDGIVFLKDLGFLDMHILEENEEAEDESLACYLVALLPSKPGCLAVRLERGEGLSEFLRDWQEKEVELYIISRPEEHGEYEPYRFSTSLEAFREKLESAIGRKEGEN